MEKEPFDLLDEKYKLGYNQALKDVRKEVKLSMEITREDTGSFKYDVCYEEVLEIINKLRK